MILLLCYRFYKFPEVYLVEIGRGLSAADEKARSCPSCGGEWALAAPLHEIFDFKCDSCRLVSNLSWDFKD